LLSIDNFELVEFVKICISLDKNYRA